MNFPPVPDRLRPRQGPVVAIPVGFEQAAGTRLGFHLRWEAGTRWGPRIRLCPAVGVLAIVGFWSLSVSSLAGPVAPALPMSDGPEILDPLFQFFIELVEQDRLGFWSQPDLQVYIRESGRPSRLPADKIVGVERRRAVGDEAQIRRGARVTRIWELTLAEPLKVPMPYSVLGYHPGSLKVSQELVLSEWWLNGPNLHVVADGAVQVVPTTGMTALRCDVGWVVLDADALIDRLLGGKLDDFWTEGFAFCRVQGQLLGLAAGRGRKLRPLFGEFDFRRDKVITKSGPVARGFSRHIRPWLAGPKEAPSRLWRFEE